MNVTRVYDCRKVTWQLPNGHGVSVQLVNVHQSGQSFGSSSLVLIVGEVMLLGGQVGDEHWDNHQRGRRGQSTRLCLCIVCVCVCMCVYTIWQVCENQLLQLHPLCIESLDQFEGINWVSQETLGVLSGRCRQDVQPVGPSSNIQHNDELHWLLTASSHKGHAASVSWFDNPQLLSQWLTVWSSSACPPPPWCSFSARRPGPAPLTAGHSCDLAWQKEAEKWRKVHASAQNASKMLVFSDGSWVRKN